MIGNTYQFEGHDAKATDVKYENGVFSMNIAGAYKCEGLERIDRRFSFTDETVTLTDSFVYTGTEQITDRIVTFLKAEKTADNTVTVEDVTITFDPTQVDLEITTEKSSRDVDIYLIDFKLKAGVDTCSCTMR